MDKNIKVGIDMDNCTTPDNSKEFLRIMCHLLNPEYEIHLITNRNEQNRVKITKELMNHGIQYSQLVMTDNKADYLSDQRIEINIG